MSWQLLGVLEVLGYFSNLACLRYLAYLNVLAYSSNLACLSVLAYFSYLAYLRVLSYFSKLACLSVLAYFCVLAYFSYLACLIVLSGCASAQQADSILLLFYIVSPMAEGGPETSPQPSPFHIEAIILAKEESTTSEKRLHARFLKDVKIKERDSKQPMVARPVWPYEYWRTNNTDSST